MLFCLFFVCFVLFFARGTDSACLAAEDNCVNPQILERVLRRCNVIAWVSVCFLSILAYVCF